ncbi:MAG: hypothetical protein PVI63_06850 [Anaerolineae bacterium]
MTGNDRWHRRFSPGGTPGGELVRRRLVEGRLSGVVRGLSQLMLQLMRWRRGFQPSLTSPMAAWAGCGR